ncbi:MAG: glutathione synthase [Porticoccaceae bacterium]|jgi:glutathione synthase
MSIHLGIIMDPIENISPKKDTTLGMIVSALKLNWKVSYIQQGNIYSADGVVRHISQQITSASFDPQNWYSLGEEIDTPLADLDAVIMRVDPPFNMEYVYTTYMLEVAEQQGLLVVNKPQSLRDCNEKFFATHFPQCCPPLIVSSNPQLLRDFYDAHGDIVVKPLDGMGGEAIFRVKKGDPNFSVILETLTQHGKTTIMAQKFITQISAGDKRILMVNGKPIPYGLARIPPAGETRGNLAAGGRGVAQVLNERDLWIANEIGPELVRRGLLFVGLDVIGDYLTEINVTSPTCAREIDAAFDTDITGQLMQAIAEQLA